MNTRHSLAWAALTVTLLSGATAHASPITFEFTGTVGFINTDPSDPFGGDIGFGTDFSGSYTFESSATDSVPLDPQTGSYFFFEPSSGLSVDFGGGHVFNLTDAFNIGVNNDFSTGDIYTVLATTSSFDPVVELFLRDDTATVFSDDSLPTDAPPFDAWSLTRFTLTGNDIDGNQVEIVGALDSLTCTVGCIRAEIPVPLPGTLALLGLGLGALGAVRCRCAECV